MHTSKAYRDVSVTECPMLHDRGSAMRKALVVGINYYASGSPLHGCVHDARSLGSVLERHADGTPNFSVRLLTATSPRDAVTRDALKDGVANLFATDCDVALFYFAGHGYIEVTGGYLWASDTRRGDDGLSLDTILRYANRSSARNKIVILDSCYSGIAGSSVENPQVAELKEGITILTASTENQYATEINGSGLFTNLLIDALSGSAANLVGEVSPGSIYAHIDKSLGAWERQRPVFKTNVKRFISLRNVQPSIRLADLQRLIELFPSPGYELQLDPSFEPELAGRSDGMPPPHPENTAKFAVLQRYNRVSLLVPVGAPHMWHAAMESKTCRLTVLGEHYRRLVEQKLL
jgi:hypothetical protein